VCFNVERKPPVCCALMLNVCALMLSVCALMLNVCALMLKESLWFDAHLNGQEQLRGVVGGRTQAGPRPGAAAGEGGGSGDDKTLV